MGLLAAPDEAACRRARARCAGRRPMRACSALGRLLGMTTTTRRRLTRPAWVQGSFGKRSASLMANATRCVSSWRLASCRTFSGWSRPQLVTFFVNALLREERRACLALSHVDARGAEANYKALMPQTMATEAGQEVKHGDGATL